MNMAIDHELALLEKIITEEERIKQLSRNEIDAAFGRLDQAFADAIEKCKPIQKPE